LTAKPPGARRGTSRRTELRRASAQAARRLAREAVEREWRVFLTAKFDRTWKAMIRFRAKVKAARFRELMAELTSTIDNNVADTQSGACARSSRWCWGRWLSIAAWSSPKPRTR
jgi:hypothetical protein